MARSRSCPAAGAQSMPPGPWTKSDVARHRNPKLDHYRIQQPKLPGNIYHHGQRELWLPRLRPQHLPHTQPLQLRLRYRNADSNRDANSATAHLPTPTVTPTPTQLRLQQQHLHRHRQHTDGDCNSNSYTYAHTGPNHTYCARALGTRATGSGPVLERRDFESGRRLPRRRVDRYHQERRFLHRSNRWRWAWHLYVSSVQCRHSDLF